MKPSQGTLFQRFWYKKLDYALFPREDGIKFVTELRPHKWEISKYCTNNMNRKADKQFSAASQISQPVYIVLKNL